MEDKFSLKALAVLLNYAHTHTQKRERGRKHIFVSAPYLLPHPFLYC